MTASSTSPASDRLPRRWTPAHHPHLHSNDESTHSFPREVFILTAAPLGARNNIQLNGPTNSTLTAIQSLVIASLQPALFRRSVADGCRRIAVWTESLSWSVPERLIGGRLVGFGALVEGCSGAFEEDEEEGPKGWDAG